MARCCGLGLVCFALVAAAASATQFRVGEQRGWSVPDGSAEPYNAWAGRMRFHIGDQLLFVYPKETDSVLLVDQGAYDKCNTTSYVAKFDDGSTVFTFDRSGPFFFISGNEANCRANEKLIVLVLADRTPPAVSPSPPSMPSMPPPSAAPMPSPPSPPSMPPPSGAPMPSPSAAPMPSPPSPSMPPPSGAPTPSPSSSPSSSPPSAASMPAPAAPGPAPMATPGSPPSPATLAPSPSSSTPGTPGGVSQPPSASTNPPGAEGANTTTPGSGAATVAAGLASSLAAYIGYAMLAV